MRLPRLPRRSRLSLLMHAGIASMLAATAGHAAVTSCVVNTSADDPATASSAVTNVTASGTLRDCILAANLSTGSTGHPTLPGMSITFDATMSGATIGLSSALPLLFNNASVDASALASPVTIDGGNAHRIFFVSGLPPIPVSGKPDPDGAQAITVSLRNLVLQHAFALGGSTVGRAGGGMGAGGALFVNKQATVTATNVSFNTNFGYGGNAGTATTGYYGGGGMGNGISGSGGGGLGVWSNGNNGGGIGTSGPGTTAAAGGWGGQGLGQLSTTQNFSAASFDVDSGSGASGKGLIGGGASSTASGYSGAGGFGGGGTVGGAGGFGSGGGAGTFPTSHGGVGGFGGGGGYGSGFNGNGHGGFGGGSGSNGGGGVGGGNTQGGGGAGFGGAVFVRNGAAFIIQATTSNCAISGNATVAGTGTTGITSGGATAGKGLFLMTGVTTTFDIAGKYTIDDDIADDSLSSVPSGHSYAAGNGVGAAITKQGSGILALNGANTFAGATTVSAGVLRVGSPGNINSSATTVAVAGTLTGDGSIGNTDVFGTIAPGHPANPQGTLSVNGALHIQTGALTCFHANSTNAISDFNVSGAVTLNSVARIDFSGGPAVGATYYPISGGSVSGKFSGYETNMPNLVGHLSYSSTLVTFTVDASDVLFANDFETPISDSPCVAAFAN